ncbi:MAG: TolC family protein, partial [Alphaproteobacteria bacterium]|nr:TolC family protein [Alphaproteobacteria bacterium]
MQSFVGLRSLFLAGVALLAIGAVSSASAETLQDAFSGAYHKNSTLEAERARQRATDELVPQALSGWRPTVTATVTQGHQIARSTGPSALGNITTYSETNPGSLQITLNQPLFRGFKTVEGTAQAEASVRAGRDQLLAVEQTTLLNAVTAYMNVVQNRQILSLRQKNVRVLQSQLNASNARFKAGELTRTDVAQSSASLSGAKGQVALAVANVKAAEANYLTVVGHLPGKLVMPNMAKRPESLEVAYRIAQETNPNILAAAQVQDAAEHNVNVQKGDLLPSVSLQATASTSWEQSGVGSSASVASVVGVVTVPIYEQGLRYSLTRQAKETVSQNRV